MSPSISPPGRQARWPIGRSSVGDRLHGRRRNRRPAFAASRRRLLLALDAVQPVAGWVIDVPDIDDGGFLAFRHRREIAFQHVRRGRVGAAGQARCRARGRARQAAAVSGVAASTGCRRSARTGSRALRRRRRSWPAAALRAVPGRKAVLRGSATAGRWLQVRSALQPCRIGVGTAASTAAAMADGSSTSFVLLQAASGSAASNDTAIAASCVSFPQTSLRHAPRDISYHYGFTARSSRDHGGTAASAAISVVR